MNFPYFLNLLLYKFFPLDSSDRMLSMKQKKIYTDGEQFYYLGNIYTFKIAQTSKIILKDNYILFPIGALFRAEKEITAWYIHQAKEVIIRRLFFHSVRMKKIYKSIRLSDTSSKWGTCFADNSLQFNWRLIMAPLLVLDYVVIHELAHTKHKNHGIDFWKEVRSYTPAYKQHRKWLNENSKLLHF